MHADQLLICSIYKYHVNLGKFNYLYDKNKHVVYQLTYL